MTINDILDVLKIKNDRLCMVGTSIDFKEVDDNQGIYYTVSTNGDVMINSDDMVIQMTNISILLANEEFVNKNFEIYTPRCIIKSGYIKTTDADIHDIITRIGNQIAIDFSIIQILQSKNPHSMNYLREHINKDRFDYLSSGINIFPYSNVIIWNGIYISGFEFHFDFIDVEIRYIDEFVNENKLRKMHHIESIPYDPTKSVDRYAKVKCIYDTSNDINIGLKDADATIQYIKAICGDSVEYEDDGIKKFYPIVF